MSIKIKQKKEEFENCEYENDLVIVPADKARKIINELYQNTLESNAITSALSLGIYKDEDGNTYMVMQSEIAPQELLSLSQPAPFEILIDLSLICQPMISQYIKGQKTRGE